MKKTIIIGIPIAIGTAFLAALFINGQRSVKYFTHYSDHKCKCCCDCCDEDELNSLDGE